MGNLADNLRSLLSAGQDVAQGASNAVAGNVSGPVDLISWGLRKAGLGNVIGSAPVGGSEWMAQRGITREPKNALAGGAGETLGLLSPLAATKAPQIANGLLRMGENALAPATMNPQMGAIALDSGVGKLPYQIEHKPMGVAGGAAQLHDLTPAFGEDVYGKNAQQFFGQGDPREKGVLKTLAAVRGKPDAPVTIYRGVPSDAKGINPGDWVTLSKEVAADYASQHPGGRVVEMNVPASHVTSWADSLLEQGYHPPKTLADQLRDKLK